MEVVAAVLAIGIAVGIAVALVGREAVRLGRRPPPPLFDLDEALAWVVDNIDDDVAATLTPDDVKRILGFQVEFFRSKGVSTNGRDLHPVGSVVVGGAETVAYVLERSAATGEAYLPEQVHAVVVCQLAYLRAIGAVGPEVRPDES